MFQGIITLDFQAYLHDYFKCSSRRFHALSIQKFLVFLAISATTIEVSHEDKLKLKQLCDKIGNMYPSNPSSSGAKQKVSVTFDMDDIMTNGTAGQVLHVKEPVCNPKEDEEDASERSTDTVEQRNAKVAENPSINDEAGSGNEDHVADSVSKHCFH